MDCLYAQCVPHITDCVMAELEKLGQKYRVALRVAKDPRFVRLPCTHPGTYADDCICERVRQHKCYIVATCDTDLKRRLRKIRGCPSCSSSSIDTTSSDCRRRRWGGRPDRRRRVETFARARLSDSIA